MISRGYRWLSSDKEIRDASIVRLVRYNRLPDKARYLKWSVLVVVPCCGKSLETFTRYHKQQIEAIASVW